MWQQVIYCYNDPLDENKNKQCMGNNGRVVWQSTTQQLFSLIKPTAMWITVVASIFTVDLRSISMQNTLGNVSDLDYLHTVNNLFAMNQSDSNFILNITLTTYPSTTIPLDSNQSIILVFLSRRVHGI
jgi:hypothetical protein